MAKTKKSFWSFGLQTITNLFRPPQKYGNSYFYSAQYNPWSEIDHLKSFLEVPELNAVICTKARMFGNGIIKEVNDDGTEVKGSKLVELLAKPNWMQGGKEFLRQTKIFREIFGDEYLYQLVPFGMDIETAKQRALFTIPGNWIRIQYTDVVPYFMHVAMPEQLKYIVRYNGSDIVIPQADIIHMNDDRADLSNEQYAASYDLVGSTIVKGQSKLVALTPAVNNIKMAYETRGVMLKSRGALGILSNSTSDKVGAIPLDPDERDRVQKEYSENYGGLNGQRQIIITSADLRWQQMAISPDKMGLFQEIEADFNKILDAYGMPSELFVRNAGATYENQKVARKGVYVDTIMPEANEWINGINNKYRSGAKTKLVVDYMHLPIFAEDMKWRGETLSVMVNALSKALQDGAISIEQYKMELEKLGIKN